MPSNMRAALAAAAQRTSGRTRSNSLSAVPPARSSGDYLPELAAIAASILYQSPVPSKDGRPVYVLNAAAFPDAYEVDYDSLLSYVLARLPGEDELISGTEYEIVFFAGGTLDNATAEKKQGPATGWYLQAYHVLGRALRKKLQMLYIVHPRTWVRVLINVFGTIVSPKFRRKIVHVNSLSALALHIPIEQLLIPPSAYLQDRKGSPDIYAPFVTGKRAFGARHALQKSIHNGKTRLPRVLRESTSFLVLPDNIKTEGLFRIPPHSTLLGVLKESYDRGQKWIIWKERDAVVVQPGIDEQLVEEVRLEDAYGVHLAASLIKTWYRELREPIFPESSYPILRERYSHPGIQVTPEDLVDFILPASSASPLTTTSREILTRHLLPMLSLVASHERDNKMNAENLAICFSMCLICGANQMDDAKASSIVKRVLQAAIEWWPQFQKGMGLDETAFFADLAAPRDPNEYEDPLEDVKRTTSAEIHEKDGEIGHIITMNEFDSSPSDNEKTPALPPRRSRAQSLKKALRPHLPNVELPNLPSLPNLPKRKPTPHHPEPPSPYSDHEPGFEATVVGEPPRYSTIFDADGTGIHVADPAVSYVPTDGFGPPRRADFSFDMQDEKRVAPPVPEPIASLPKRKPVSRQASVKAEGSPVASATTGTSKQASETTALLARMAAQQAANNLAQKNTVDTSASASPHNAPSSAPTDLAIKSPQSASSEGDNVFRKPSWPASAMQKQQPSQISSLARPIVPARKSNTIPIITGVHMDGSDDGLRLQHVLKPRAPSPGLLKRMASMENQNGASEWTQNSVSGTSSSGAPVRSNTLGVAPRPLNLRKSSVDDLRRLYEERATTAATLAVVGRRASSNH